jgi:O-antigen ligase
VLAVDLAALPVLLALTMFIESVSIGPVPIGRLAGAAALAGVAIAVVRSGRVPLHRSWLLAAVAGLGIWILVSSFWASDTGLVRTTAFSYGLAIAYMLAFAVLVRTRRQLTSVLTALVAGSVIFGSIAFAAYALGVGVGGVQEGRVQAFAGDPNYFAVYQVAALPAALVLAAGERRAWMRLFLYGAVIVVVLSVVSTLSRTGVVALATVVLLTLLAPSRLVFGRPGRKLAYVAALAFAALAAAFAGSAEFVGRVQTILNPGEGRGSGRTDLFAAAMTGWREHPWLGLGAGNFQSASLHLLQSTPGVNVQASYASAGRVVHNAYLELLVELGPVGLALFLLVLALAAAALVRSARRARSAGEAGLERAAVGVGLALVAFGVSALFLSNQLGKLVWVLIGLAIALDETTRRSARPAPVTREKQHYDLAVRDGAVEQRERRVADQFEAIRAERRRLAELEESLQERLRALEAREREAAERFDVLAKRVEALTARERALAVRATRDVVVEREPEPEPVVVAPPPQPAPAATVGANLVALEQLVTARGAQFPDRVEEWGYYLVYLREYADLNGQLPSSFDGLVGDVFGDLLG